VRTPAGFSGRQPCFGESITSSASPMVKFITLSALLLATADIGAVQNQLEISAARSMCCD
jgi:hypothetical protein